MEQGRKLLFTITILITLIFGLYFLTDWVSKTTGYFTGNDERTAIAYCLSNKEVFLFDSLYCAECEKQREIFGESIKQIKTINCDKEKELCENLTLPSWQIDNLIYQGRKSFGELKNLTGC